MKRILFLRNRIDVPERYNYALNYGWVDKGESEGLYTAFDWYIDDIPTIERLNAYLADNEIDCIISMCAAPQRFEAFNAGKWLSLIEHCNTPTILRAGDSCYESWSDYFYQVWDHILYRMADKHGKYPDNGMFIPWNVDMDVYTPEYGGDQIVMVNTCNDAYPLRFALRDLNQKHGGALFLDMCNMAHEIKGANYIECLQNARAIISTPSKYSPETSGKVVEAAACGTLVVTPRTKYLDHYFSDDQVYLFETGAEFVDVCNRVKQMDMDVTISQQRAVYEHVVENHNCIKFVNEYILPAVDAATKGSR